MRSSGRPPADGTRGRGFGSRRDRGGLRFSKAGIDGIRERFLRVVGTRAHEVIVHQAPRALDVARAEHTAIYDAVAAGNADLARAATLIHIARNEAWLREHLGPADDVPLPAGDKAGNGL